MSANIGEYRGILPTLAKGTADGSMQSTKMAKTSGIGEAHLTATISKWWCEVVCTWQEKHEEKAAFSTCEGGNKAPKERAEVMFRLISSHSRCHYRLACAHDDWLTIQIHHYTCLISLITVIRKRHGTRGKGKKKQFQKLIEDKATTRGKMKPVVWVFHLWGGRKEIRKRRDRTFPFYHF